MLEPKQQIARLRSATPKQLLEALIRHMQHTTTPFTPREAELLRWGFEIGQPGGWKEIAPAWLDETPAIEIHEGWA